MQCHGSLRKFCNVMLVNLCLTNLESWEVENLLKACARLDFQDYDRAWSSIICQTFLRSISFFRVNLPKYLLEQYIILWNRNQWRYSFVKKVIYIITVHTTCMMHTIKFSQETLLIWSIQNHVQNDFQILTCNARPSKSLPAIITDSC